MSAPGVISKLLQPSSSSSKKNSLIVDLEPSPLEEFERPDTTTSTSSKTTENAPLKSCKDDEEPSMFELMMAAQKEAAIEKAAVVTTEKKVQETTFANGFKKGFFGNSKPKKEKDAACSNKSATAKPLTDFDDDIIDLTGVSGKKSEGRKVNLNLAGGTKNKSTKESDKFVFDDVQKALEEEKHPLLQQISKNEWVTPDLMDVFQSNPVLARGFRDPKCMAAIQLMQSNPKEALEKFKDDADVSFFLREFGATMASHFEKLGEAQKASTEKDQKQAGASAPIIQEVGPLQAKALQKQKEAAARAATNSTTASSSSSATSKKTGVAVATKAAGPSADEMEAERVQQVLQDPELRSLLMDASFQALLLECNDPVKFQQHMRDPETARKIKKLHDSGLVKTQV